MHHFVPDFDTDDDYVNNPNSSSFSFPRKSHIGQEDDLMELLWHNGQVVVQNQRLNNNKKPSSSTSPPKVQASTLNHQSSDQNLFIQEDEMSSWLHYPLRDNDFCSDLIFPSAAATPTAPTTTTQVATAVIPPAVTPPSNGQKPPVRNFMNFSRIRGNFNGRGESGPSISNTIVRESTQVSPIASEATATATAAEESKSGFIRRTDDDTNSSAVGGDGVNRKEKEVAETIPAIEIPGKSSSIVSKSEIEPEKTTVDERKRKEREVTEVTECRSEQETKQARGLTSAKRSRAAEVHNLSERKRRDRINERMKALQELIPRCNKSDKASMLDEAIEYMKSLQLQIQMMSMGCGMMPMMYPGMQQYMAMGMNMNQQPLPPHSFMPFPNMMAPQRPLPTQIHMGASMFPTPQYPDPSRVYVQNQQCDPTSRQPPIQGYIDSYQQFLRSVHPDQPPQFQNQATSYPSSSRVSSSKESEDHGNHTTS